VQTQKLGLCSTATVNKAAIGGKKPQNCKETQKEMIHCQATVQVNGRAWKRCGITALLGVLTGGEVLVCLQFTFTVRTAVNWL